MFSSLPSDGTFMLPYVENRVSNATPSSIANFGSSSYANSSSATDGRVHGDFEYGVGKKIRKARQVKNFSQDQKINKELFSLALEYVK